MKEMYGVIINFRICFPHQSVGKLWCLVAFSLEAVSLLRGRIVYCELALRWFQTCSLLCSLDSTPTICGLFFTIQNAPPLCVLKHESMARKRAHHCYSLPNHSKVKPFLLWIIALRKYIILSTTKKDNNIKKAKIKSLGDISWFVSGTYFF